MNQRAHEFILISCSQTACQDTVVSFGVLSTANYLPKYFRGYFQIYKLVVRFHPPPPRLQYAIREFYTAALTAERQ